LGNSIRLRLQTGLQVWRTYMVAMTQKGLGRTLKIKLKPQLKGIYVCKN